MRVKKADAIAEGVWIARAAARLAVKNQILVDTISANGEFDPVHYCELASERLLALAEESDREAKRLRSEWRAAFGRYSHPEGTHDYRDKDLRNLRRRRKQALGVAVRLRELAEDQEEIGGLVEAAREAAWLEVQNNLNRTLRPEILHPEADPDYARMRDARMQALRTVDLDLLAAQVKARERAEQ